MLRSIFVTTLSLLLSFSLSAHPHVSISSQVTLDCADGNCKGFWVDWTFDRIFSSSIIREFDLDRNQKFSEKENTQVYENAFINLENYGYFIFLRKGTKRFNPRRVSEFKATISGTEKLVYRFYVPLEDYSLGKDFHISVFDRTFYCAISLNQKAVSNSDLAKYGSYTLETNRQYPIYYNPLGTVDDMTIYTVWKPGLETAYPEEIHVKLK